MPGSPVSRSRVGLDLDADHSPVRELDQDVHLVSAIGVADLKQSWLQIADRALGTQLRHHETLQKSAQQVAVAQDGPCIDAKQRPDECGIDQMPFRQTDEPVQLVCRPRGQLVGDKQALQQRIVGVRRRPLDPGSVGQVPAADQPRRGAAVDPGWVSFIGAETTP